MTRAALCLALLLLPFSAGAHECGGIEQTALDTARCKLRFWEMVRDRLYAERAVLWRRDGLEWRWRNFDIGLPSALIGEIERVEERVRAFMRDVEEAKR